MIVFKGNNGDDMDVFGKQTCSRLRKCSFTAFSSCEDFVENSRTSDEERAQMTTGAYNEVRD